MKTNNVIGKKSDFFFILKNDFLFSEKAACQKFVDMVTSKSINANRPQQMFPR